MHALCSKSLVGMIICTVFAVLSIFLFNKTIKWIRYQHRVILGFGFEVLVSDLNVCDFFPDLS